MKVLLVGGGGREHALGWAIARSPEVSELICAPGNAGLAQLGRCFPGVKATNIDAICALAAAEAVDFAVVASDDPLALGCVDRLEAMGVQSFGASMAAARLESSKAFAKAFMKRHGIPTAAWETFQDAEAALAYVSRAGAPIVVKADGLALGKGVVVAQTVPEAQDAVRRLMLDRAFGESGARIVIEEFMPGREATLLCFCDGETARAMPISRDHKRARDGDQGPNTGGMGAFAPVADMPPALVEQAMREVVLPTLAGMKAEGTPFRGVIYAELMLTPDGPKVIEFNARFGDPEAQTILPLLEGDIVPILRACRDGALSRTDIRWKNACSCCVVLASGGYPEHYDVGFPIQGIPAAQSLGCMVFHAGTRCEGDAIVTAGGRVLGVVAVAATHDAAVNAAYAAADAITFKGLHRRNDIGRGAGRG